MTFDEILASLGWQSQHARRYIANCILSAYRLSTRAIRVDVDDIADDVRYRLSEVIAALESVEHSV
jgi:hypothetical protein